MLKKTIEKKKQLHKKYKTTIIIKRMKLNTEINDKLEGKYKCFF